MSIDFWNQEIAIPTKANSCRALQYGELSWDMFYESYYYFVASTRSLTPGQLLRRGYFSK